MSDRELSRSTAPSDFKKHIERLRHLRDHAEVALQTFFQPDLPIRVARAPGRLDVMGGIGDYSGSLVLEMPIAEAAFAAVQKSADHKIWIASLSQDETEDSRFLVISAEQFGHLLQSDYQSAGRELHRDPALAWGAYVLGPILVLLKETGTTLPSGLRILI